MMKNIVWICTDQQRADSLGCMGNIFAQTPRLDALAKKGTLLKRLISAHPVCMPSRASMLTGAHPPRHGVTSNGVALAERQDFDHERASHSQTMAHHLQDHGYHTRCIGKLHLEPHQAALERGYRESYAMWASGKNDNWSGPLYGFEHLELSENHGARVGGAYQRWLEKEYPEEAKKLAEQEQWAEQPTSFTDLQATPISANASTTMWIAHRFQDFLNEREEQNDSEKPFFCWLGIPDPHHPWQPPQEMVDQFIDKDVMPSVPNEKINPPSWWPRLRGGGNDLSNREDQESATKIIKQFTNAQNALIDMAVGKIIDDIKAVGLENDTIIAFCSDHGDYLGDYELVRKNGYGSVSLNHIPGIIYDPAASISGEHEEVCGQVDMPPTLCKAAGVDWQVPDGVALQDHFPGRSFVPYLQVDDGGTPMGLNWWTDHEHFCYYPQRDEYELYDHRNDPGELNNIAKDYPERCQEFKTKVMMELTLCQETHSHRHSGW